MRDPRLWLEWGTGTTGEHENGVGNRGNKGETKRMSSAKAPKQKDHLKPRIQAERQEAVPKPRVCSRREARHRENIMGYKEKTTWQGKCLFAG